MTKNTLIRSEKKHAVKMPAGSNVAERKTSQKFAEPESVAELPDNIQKLAPLNAPVSKRKVAPPPSAKPVRAKPKLTPPSPSPAKATKSTKSRTTVSKIKIAKLPVPQPPIWSEDSQVKQRIEQLKSRNAQLAEQLQRLPTSPKARGQ